MLKASPLPISFDPKSFKNFTVIKQQNGQSQWHRYGIYLQKEGSFPETKRLWIERNHLLKPDKTRIVGKGNESERIQEYRLNQGGRKRIAELGIELYNRFFHYCETLETTPLQEFQQKNNESWISNYQSDGESQISRAKQDKCPTNALRRFRKHETVNLIMLKQTAKMNTSISEQKRQLK